MWACALRPVPIRGRQQDLNTEDLKHLVVTKIWNCEDLTAKAWLECEDLDWPRRYCRIALREKVGNDE